MQAVSDEQLIRWVAQGDVSCVGTLFERHHKGVFRYCLQITKDKELSEDLVQEVFMKVLRKAKTYRGEGSFKAWLFNMARNVGYAVAMTSVNGRLSVGLPERSKAQLQIDTAKGEVVSDFEVELEPTKPVVQRGDNGRGYQVQVEKVIVANINGGGGVVKLKTLNGDVEILKTGN